MAGVVMAESLTAGFVGGDFDELGGPLGKLILGRLVVCWVELKSRLSAAEPTVDVVKQYVQLTLG